MNNKIDEIETVRLSLIPTSEKDTEFIFELMNSPKWIEYIGDRNIKSLDRLIDLVRNSQFMREPWRFYHPS